MPSIYIESNPWSPLVKQNPYWQQAFHGATAKQQLTQTIHHQNAGINRWVPPPPPPSLRHYPIKPRGLNLLQRGEIPGITHAPRRAPDQPWRTPAGTRTRASAPPPPRRPHHPPLAPTRSASPAPPWASPMRRGARGSPWAPPPAPSRRSPARTGRVRDGVGRNPSNNQVGAPRGRSRRWGRRRRRRARRRRGASPMSRRRSRRRVAEGKWFA